MKIVHRVTAKLATSAEVARRFLPCWSGVLVFDGKVIRVYDRLATRLRSGAFSKDELHWLHKMRWLCGVDHGTGDLPHYALAESESQIDLVIYFEQLKSLKYPMKAVVCDGNRDIPRAAHFVFGDDLVIQRCTRHFLEDLRAILPPEKEVGEDVRSRLEQLIIAIKSVIESHDLPTAAARFEALPDIRRVRNPVARTMLAMFHEAKKELTAHLTHPELKLPHTSNDAENLFKQLMLRIKTIGRFFHHRYAGDYLNAWALLRRFTIFTDCKGERKYRNGHAPLELTGCEIKNIDPLKLQK